MPIEEISMIDNMLHTYRKCNETSCQASMIASDAGVKEKVRVIVVSR